jgi:hypothetical protein
VGELLQANIAFPEAVAHDVKFVRAANYAMNQIDKAADERNRTP